MRGIVLLVLLVVSGFSATASPSGPWRVEALREPRDGDVPFEPAAHGPDSLIAHVVIKERRGYVYIENVRTGESVPLLDRYASLPQWSPDGRYLTCVAWHSQLKPYVLTVVDIASRSIVLESDLAHGTDSKWSPDSRAVAADGLAYEQAGCLLYTITVPDGRVAVLDSLDMLECHDLSWSPDSRWIAFSRPTSVHHHGDPITSDLWIGDAVTGKSWRILEADDWAVREPTWTTNRSIMFTRVRWSETGPIEESVQVVEVSLTTDSLQFDTEKRQR